MVVNDPSCWGKSTWIEPISQTRSTYRSLSQDILLIESHECVTRASVTVDCLINLFDFFVLQKNIQKGTFVRWIAPSWRRCCVALYARSWIMINAESHVHAGLCCNAQLWTRAIHTTHEKKQTPLLENSSYFFFSKIFFGTCASPLHLLDVKDTRFERQASAALQRRPHCYCFPFSLLLHARGRLQFQEEKKRNKLYTERLPFNRQPCREV